MSQHADSKALFSKQIRDHSRMLCDLLACSANEPVPADLMDRCTVSTRMLAGTCGLMGFTAWEKSLGIYEGFLNRRRGNQFLWDEKIAQVTSELIEKEELLVMAHESDPSADLNVVVHPDELQALYDEIVALQETDDVNQTVEGTPQSGRDVARTEAELCEVADPPLDGGNSGAGGDAGKSTVDPMTGVVSELKKVTDELMKGLDTDAFNSRSWTSPEIEVMRTRLHFVDFYVRTIDETIGLNGDIMPQLPRCGLAPLDVALKDFAAELSLAGGQQLEIDLVGDNIQIDPRLLQPAYAVLRWLITDVYNRSEVSPVCVSAEIKEDKGAIHWQLSDNGGNFITDSRLDHEDQLAFYPGLKKVRKILDKLHSVLCVEPQDKKQIRFEFSLPASKERESFVVWSDDDNTFGIRSAQLCDLIPADTDAKGADSYGEFLTIDNKRVPLIKLDVLFQDAPDNGKMIAVIGHLEMRVAFYVPDAGTLADGKILERSIPFWQGCANVVAEVDGKRLALMDAEQILAGYLDLTNGTGTEGVSGGAIEDDSQAASISDAQAPPDRIASTGDGSDIDVLVVEQSDTLRKVLRDILEDERRRVMFADGLDEALDLIRTGSARLIISEFRMPSMAAKVLVDTLKKEGKSVPVLVTTSQSGQTAELLAKKLGAADFLSKPLNRQDVAQRISNVLVDSVHVG